MKEIKLASGAILKLGHTPFAESKALYQAILREGRSLKLDSQTQLLSIYKDLFCSGFASPEVETTLWPCLNRCIYNNGKGDLKIDQSTFEPMDARKDYTEICLEVTKENCLPFLPSRYVELLRVLMTTLGDQA